MMPGLWDSDFELPPSPCSTDSSLDEDEVNYRVTPYWPSYRDLLASRGFRLDTVRDVKEFYSRHPEERAPSYITQSVCGYSRLCDYTDDDALCPDAGLPDNLFRGARIRDGKKIVIKAVHLYSREYDVVRLLSTPPLRNDPMNHTIPVLDLVEAFKDEIAFIVMEEWSSQLISDTSPCCLTLFLSSLRQCIEHVVFLHKHLIAHLDISLRNLVTNYEGRYAYIDYELSRRFDGVARPYLCGYRGTEVPPECERAACYDPFKVDVWALAVLILRACKLTGYYVPQLMHLVKPMLHDDPDERPSIGAVLQAFDLFVPLVGSKSLDPSCPSVH